MRKADAHLPKKWSNTLKAAMSKERKMKQTGIAAQQRNKCADVLRRCALVLYIEQVKMQLCR